MSRRLFPTKQEVDKLSQFVKKETSKNLKQLKKDGLKWTRTAWANRLDYEVSWLGIPIIQNPYDMIIMQEIIFEVKPDIIVETGIAHGGSLIYYSSLLELLGKGKVIGIDIDIREHNRKLLDKHPLIGRIEMIEGSSVDPKIIRYIKAQIKPKDVVMVILDSDHTKPHVLAELNTYKDIVTKSSYLIVFDTLMPYLVGLKGETPYFKNNSAMDALREFMGNNSQYQIDKSRNKFYVSSCPDGFLKKIKD